MTADRAEADPREWLLGALEAGATQWPKRACPIDAIGVSALGPRPVLVTREGEAVSPALLFGLDRRAEEQRARLGATHDHALPKLLWWAEHEQSRFARAHTAVDAAGFVVAGLCGKLVMDSITAEAYAVAESRLTVPLPQCDPLARRRRVCCLGRRRRARSGAGTPVFAGTLDARSPNVAGTRPPPAQGASCSARRWSSTPSRPEPSQCRPRGAASPGPGRLAGGASGAGGRRSPGWTTCSAAATTICTRSSRAPGAPGAAVSRR